jgi:hypothetical protein
MAACSMKRQSKARVQNRLDSGHSRRNIIRRDFADGGHPSADERLKLEVGRVERSDTRRIFVGLVSFLRRALRRQDDRFFARVRGGYRLRASPPYLLAAS